MRIGGRNSRAVTIVTAIILIALAGCIPPSQQQARERGLAAVGRPALTPYTLQPGDGLTIKFFYNDELNEQLPVRPDGNISLQLIGDVKAAGLTVPELRQLLIEKYTGVIKKPEVAVIVNHFDTQKVYVGGEVARPGVVALSPYTTALQAVSMAGGSLPTAQLKNVVVVRDQGTERPDILLVNLDNALTKLSDCEDIALQPRDIVWVPQSAIAKVNQFVDQYIERVLPISRTLQLNYNFGEIDSNVTTTTSGIRPISP